LLPNKGMNVVKVLLVVVSFCRSGIAETGVNTGYIRESFWREREKEGERGHT
jgi:hypothetical protein